MTPLFSLGAVCMTQGVAEYAKQNPTADFQNLIQRHVSGDWENMQAEDRDQNKKAIHNGNRIFSSYNITIDQKSTVFWVITEADRSVTTILFPSEY